MTRSRLKTIAMTVISLASCISLAAAQQAPVKVEQPWYMQGRLSSAISVTTSSAATALPSIGFVGWLCNTGSYDAYLALGTSNAVTTSATTGDYLKAGTCSAYDLYPLGAKKYSYVALIGSGGSTSVTVETGIGQPPSGPAVVSATVNGIVSGNLAQVNGATVNVAAGASSTGTQRVSVASDSSILTPFTGVVGNGSSTVTLTSTTTPIQANQAIVPVSGTQSFAIGNSAGAFFIQRARLISNDTTSTAWSNVNVNIDLWTAAPTGLTDRATYAPVGVANWIGRLQCTFSSIIYGDGQVANCITPSTAGFMPKLASGTTIYWTAYAGGTSGVTGASKTFTFIPEFSN